MSSADDHCTHDWRFRDSPHIRALGLGVPALRYIYHGYAVLPLVSGGKKPHPMLGDSGGVHWASADPDRIVRWWRDDPSANIGVATGGVSGLLVVDLDVKNGAPGWDALLAYLREQLLSLPVSVMSKTPSGGLHDWLRVPPGAEVRERPSILPNVDIKGDGGYVVAPPSGLLVHAQERDGEKGGMVGVPYEWAAGCPCSAPWAPDWMAGWLRMAPRGSAAGGGSKPDLDEAVAQGFARGTRNVSMYRMACSLFRQYGTTPAGTDAVIRRCRAVWDAGDKRDYPFSEVLVTVESARKFITGQEQKERADAVGFTPWVRRHGGSSGS